MKTAADWLVDVRALEGRGELVLAYDTAMRGLSEHPDDIWLKYRAVLALAKSGATRRAGDEFRRLGLADRTETDIAALTKHRRPPARYTPLVIRRQRAALRLASVNWRRHWLANASLGCPFGFFRS